LQQELRD
jgi:hypothetical protein